MSCPRCNLPVGDKLVRNKHRPLTEIILKVSSSNHPESQPLTRNEHKCNQPSLLPRGTQWLPCIPGSTTECLHLPQDRTQSEPDDRNSLELLLGERHALSCTLERIRNVPTKRVSDTEHMSSDPQKHASTPVLARASVWDVSGRVSKTRLMDANPRLWEESSSHPPPSQA